jgi:peptidoglycan/LPS O-acetylase OafA/YrhL
MKPSNSAVTKGHIAGPGSIVECEPHPAVSTPRRPAIDSLTSLRGIAAVWVVFYHFQSDLIAFLPAGAFLLPFLGQGHFAVPIFFVLSGYVLAYNYLDSIGTRPNRSGLLRFWGHRLLRIYPLHVTTLFLVLAMVVVARSLGLTISGVGYGRRDFVLNLLLIHTWVPHFRLNWNYPSWSISSEWFAYLFFPLVCPVLIRVRRFSTLAGLMLASFAVSVGHMMAGEHFPFREMTAVVGPFLLGCTFARAVALGYSPRSGLRALAWALATTLIIFPYLTGGRVLSIAMIMSGASLVYALGAAGGRCSRFWSWKPLIILGEVSYSLYLTHTLVQKLVNEICPAERFVDRPLAFRLILLGGYAAAIGLATWIAHVWIDCHFRRFIRRHISS